MYDHYFSNFGRPSPPPSPMIYTMIQPQGILGSGEEIFKGFYHTRAWRPSWSTDRDHFSNLSFPQPK